MIFGSIEVAAVSCRVRMSSRAFSLCNLTLSTRRRRPAQTLRWPVRDASRLRRSIAQVTVNFTRGAVSSPTPSLSESPYCAIRPGAPQALRRSRARFGRADRDVCANIVQSRKQNMYSGTQLVQFASDRDQTNQPLKGRSLAGSLQH